MDPMFPGQGNPPAEMLQDVRGSAKRAINFFWVFVGELALDASAGRHFVEVIGTADHESPERPLSYDVLSIESDDIFADSGTMPLREMVTSAVGRYGLNLDHSSWHEVEHRAGQLVAVLR